MGPSVAKVGARSPKGMWAGFGAAVRSARGPLVARVVMAMAISMIVVVVVVVAHGITLRIRPSALSVSKYR